jgi:hypothetical protein
VAKMNKLLVKTYKDQRQTWPAIHALRHAKILLKFSALSDKELVKLSIVPDMELYDYSFIETWDISEREKEEAIKDLIDRVNRLGVYGIKGMYVCKESGEWKDADSCFGFIGDEWMNSGYDYDIMEQTIDQYFDQ